MGLGHYLAIFISAIILCFATCIYRSTKNKKSRQQGQDNDKVNRELVSVKTSEKKRKKINKNKNYFKKSVEIGD